MGDVADRYISKSGRTHAYGRDQWSDDLITAAEFLLWAEGERAYYAGNTAGDAYRAMCRLLDIDSIGLRKAIMGPVNDPTPSGCGPIGETE